MQISVPLVGVLTKPDTLSTGAIIARQKWKQVLEGRPHSSKHGYYCVRLPDDDERSRNITRSNLQRIASEFFDSTVPWNKIADRDRLGIPGLISDISKLLINLTELTPPKLKEDAKQLLIECEELSRLLSPTIPIPKYWVTSPDSAPLYMVPCMDKVKKKASYKPIALFMTTLRHR